MGRWQDGVLPEEWFRKEREKARKLRKTRWWRKKCARGVCYYCGRKVPPQELTMDHRIPLAQGGRSEKSNLVPACKECNSKKKYLLPWEWEEYLQRLKRRKPCAVLSDISEEGR